MLWELGSILALPIPTKIVPGFCVCVRKNIGQTKIQYMLEVNQHVNQVTRVAVLNCKLSYSK